MSLEGVTCHICGDRIRMTDAWAERLDLDRDGGRRTVRIHRACGREGVERWNRQNRPRSGPLSAARRDNWTWHTEPPTDIDR